MNVLKTNNSLEMGDWQMYKHEVRCWTSQCDFYARDVRDESLWVAGESGSLSVEEAAMWLEHVLFGMCQKLLGNSTQQFWECEGCFL